MPRHRHRRRRRARERDDHEEQRRQLSKRLQSPQSLPLLDNTDPVVVAREVVTNSQSSSSLPAVRGGMRLETDPAVGEDPFALVMPRFALSPSGDPALQTGLFGHRSADRWKTRATRLPMIADQHSKAVAALVAAEMRLAGLLRRQRLQWENAAAVKIQTLGRALLARAAVRRRLEEIEAARRLRLLIKLQAQVRIYLVKGRMPHYRARKLGWLQAKAGFVLTALFRGFLGRRRARRARFERRVRCSIRIQALARRFLVRLYRWRLWQAIARHLDEAVFPVACTAIAEQRWHPQAATRIAVWYRQCHRARHTHAQRVERRRLRAAYRTAAVEAAAKSFAISGRTRLVLRVLGAKNLPNADLCSCDPFVELSLTSRTSVAITRRTATRRRTKHPRWGGPAETYEFDVRREDLALMTLRFSVIDDDVLRDDLMLQLRVPLKALLPRPVAAGWYTLRTPDQVDGRRGKRTRSQLQLELRHIVPPAAAAAAAAAAAVPPSAPAVAEKAPRAGVPKLALPASASPAERTAGPSLADMVDVDPVRPAAGEEELRLLSVRVRAPSAQVTFLGRSLTLEGGAEGHFAAVASHPECDGAVLDVFVGEAQASIPLRRLEHGHCLDRWVKGIHVVVQWRPASGLSQHHELRLNVSADASRSDAEWLAASTVAGMRFFYSPVVDRVVLHAALAADAERGALDSTRAKKALAALRQHLANPDNAGDIETFEQLRLLRASHASLAAQAGGASWTRCFDPPSRTHYFSLGPDQFSWFQPASAETSLTDPQNAAALTLQCRARVFLANRKVHGRPKDLPTAEELQALKLAKEQEAKQAQQEAARARRLEREAAAVAERKAAQAEAEAAQAVVEHEQAKAQAKAEAARAIGLASRLSPVPSVSSGPAGPAVAAVAVGASSASSEKKSRAEDAGDKEAKEIKQKAEAEAEAEEKENKEKSRAEDAEDKEAKEVKQKAEAEAEAEAEEKENKEDKQKTEAEAEEQKKEQKKEENENKEQQKEEKAGQEEEKEQEEEESENDPSARLLQRIVRGFLARLLVSRRRLAILAAKSFSSPMPGTEAGRSGWYGGGGVVRYQHYRSASSESEGARAKDPRAESFVVVEMSLAAYEGVRRALRQAAPGTLTACPGDPFQTQYLYLRAPSGELVALRKRGGQMVQVPLSVVVERRRRHEQKAAVAIQSQMRARLARRHVSSVAASLEHERSLAVPMPGSEVGESGWFRVHGHVEYHVKRPYGWVRLAGLRPVVWDSITAEARKLGAGQVVPMPGTTPGESVGGVYMKRNTKLVGLMMTPKGAWQRVDPVEVTHRQRVVAIQRMLRGWMARVRTRREFGFSPSPRVAPSPSVTPPASARVDVPLSALAESSTDAGDTTTDAERDANERERARAERRERKERRKHKKARKRAA